MSTGQSQITMNVTTPPSSVCPGGSKRSHPVEDGNEDGDDSSSGNPKRQRNTIYHPQRAQCLPCVLWSQSGSDHTLKHLHPLNNSRHVGTDAFPLSQYAQYENVTFHLVSDDCICEPCHKDFKRKHNQENRVPRWARLKNHHYSTMGNKHCIYCCGEECTCKCIHQWGPDKWYGENTSITTWKRYLSLNGQVEHTIPANANHICRKHYRRLFKLKGLQTCSVCNAFDSSTWKMVCDTVHDPDQICEAFQLSPGSVQLFSWICGQCSICYANDIRLEEHLIRDAHSSDTVTRRRSCLLLSVLNTLRTTGIVFTKEVMREHKEILTDLNTHTNQQNKLTNSFRKYLSNLTTKSQYFKVFAPAACVDTYGRVLYDERKFSTHSIAYIYKEKEEQWKKQKSYICIEKFHDLIRKQISLFPTSQNFDFTQIVDKESSIIELDQYFDKELFALIDTITTSNNSAKHSYSLLYKDLRKARIHMQIAILCLTMNPQCCFLQTITGLLCYAYGLRDKGFEVLNSLGCCCSIDHVRSHGAYWASRRQPVQNLDGQQPWRLTIDNLNFHMKYAKNLPESATGASKMLNLLTCQVTHHSSRDTPGQTSTDPVPLKQLVLKAMRDSVDPYIKSKQRSSVRVDDFFNGDGTHKCYYYQHFLAVCHACTVRRLPLPPTQYTTTFLEDVQRLMPHWTPSRKDNVVYATIEEAMSGSMSDVQSYLIRVKEELNIGKPGYPQKVTMAGDQQTYALMKELQRQSPDFNWMTVLHGDWHTLQLLAEMLRDILWDGGFKEMCYECGHKKLPTQWQEVHMLLLALYQSLLHKAMIVYNQTHEASANNYKQFWSWLSQLASDSNKNNNTTFWSRMMPFLNGYIAYFTAVRSGNWVLRNSSLRALTPLFFAYNHYKYEEVVTTAIIDSLTISDEDLSCFLSGGWTVSAKGKPHHNLALDEAHECMINLRLKTITSRPSHFRTVEMSNFMSYLDIIVRGVESHLYAHKEKEPVQYRKRYTCQRAVKINAMLKDVQHLFEHVGDDEEPPRPLCNMLRPAKHPLDSKSVMELLSISEIGKERMTRFVVEYILPAPTRGSRKRRKRSHKLATFTRKTSTVSESKKKRRRAEQHSQKCNGNTAG